MFQRPLVCHKKVWIGYTHRELYHFSYFILSITANYDAITQSHYIGYWHPFSKFITESGLKHLKKS